MTDAWIELVRWALLLLGWVYLITEASILASFRIAFADKTGAMGTAFIYCAACLGFWVGAALGALHLWPLNDTYWAIGESAFAAMVVAHTWSAFKGGNFAYAAEQQMEADHDGATEEEDG